MMETVEAGADVWSPEARQAVNNRDHSCLPAEEISGQTAHRNISKEEVDHEIFTSDNLTVGTPPQPRVSPPLLTTNTYINISQQLSTTTRPDRVSVLQNDNNNNIIRNIKNNNNNTGDDAASLKNSADSEKWYWFR